jgi:hypothetical protein
MTQKFDSIATSADTNAFTVRYSRSNRLGLVLPFVLLAALIGLATFSVCRRQPTIFSGFWLTIPLCLFGYAAMVAFVFRTGMFKSPLRIDADGSVHQGIWRWRFPGQMSAAPETVSNKSGRCLILLRYGATELQFPGGYTASSTMSVAAEANQWIAARISRGPEMLGARGGLSKVNGALRLCLLAMFGTLVLEIVASGSHYYMKYGIPYGAWAHTWPWVFAALAIGLLGMRLLNIFASDVKAAPAVWLTESVISLLMTLGAMALVAHEAQWCEMVISPMTASLVDQPLVLTRTIGGKGCHRFLIISEPLLGETVQYCDPKNIHYWDDAAGVRVRQSANGLGVHIESVERLPAY